MDDDTFAAVATALLSAHVFLAYLPVAVFANLYVVGEDIASSILDFALADYLFLDALPMATTLYVAYYSVQRSASPDAYKERIEKLAELFPYLLEEGKDLTDFGTYKTRSGKAFDKGSEGQFHMRAARMILEKIDVDKAASGALNLLGFSEAYFFVWAKA